MSRIFGRSLKSGDRDKKKLDIKSRRKGDVNVKKLAIDNPNEEINNNTESNRYFYKKEPEENTSKNDTNSLNVKDHEFIKETVKKYNNIENFGHNNNRPKFSILLYFFTVSLINS